MEIAGKSPTALNGLLSETIEPKIFMKLLMVMVKRVTNSNRLSPSKTVAR